MSLATFMHNGKEINALISGDLEGIIKILDLDNLKVI